MRDLGVSYMDFIVHPDEPEFSGSQNPLVCLGVEMTRHQQLKKQVWNKFFQD